MHPSHILKAAIPVLPAGTETPVAPKHSPAESASRAETRSGSRTEAQTDVAPRPAAPSVEITPVAPVSSAPPSQPVATTQPPATVDPPAGNPPSPATQSRQASSAERGSEPHKLIIVALAECWVHSSTDGTDVRQFSLRKGDTFVLAFSTNLTLKLGNAGGVRLRYDGQDMPPPGDDGQVKTLNFPVAR